MRLARSTAVGLAALVALAAGCGDDDAGASPSADAAAPDDSAASYNTEPVAGEHVTLRLGYFPNVTHATALVGVESGILADALGDNVTLETSTFNAGGEAVEALFAVSYRVKFAVSGTPRGPTMSHAAGGPVVGR